jgi:hypothetical protein
VSEIPSAGSGGSLCGRRRERLATWPCGCEGSTMPCFLPEVSVGEVIQHVDRCCWGHVSRDHYALEPRRKASRSRSADNQCEVITRFRTARGSSGFAVRRAGISRDAGPRKELRLPVSDDVDQSDGGNQVAPVQYGITGIGRLLVRQRRLVRGPEGHEPDVFMRAQERRGPGGFLGSPGRRRAGFLSIEIVFRPPSPAARPSALSR